MNYHSQQKNHFQQAGIMSREIGHLCFEIERLKVQNNNLVNLVYNQANQIQNQFLIEKTQLQNIKNDVVRNIKDLRQDLDEKFENIFKHQLQEIGLMTELWKLNTLIALSNMRQTKSSETITQTEPISMQDFQSQTDFQLEKNFSEAVQMDSEFQEISRENLQTEMVAEEVRNKNHHQQEIESEFEEMANKEIDKTLIYEESNENNINNKLQKWTPFEKEDEEIENSTIIEENKNHQRNRLLICMYSCKFCDQLFTSKKKLSMHKKVRHETTQCLNCSKLFASAYISRHIKYHCKSKRENKYSWFQL